MTEKTLYINRKKHKRIGLFGGSFNPPHQGHLEVASFCLQQLCLDLVLWVVAPSNPLKDPSVYAPFKSRVKWVKEIIQQKEDAHLYMRACTIEEKIQPKESVETVHFFKNMYPNIWFVWLMGADIALEMPHKWPTWHAFTSSIPIGIYPRDSQHSQNLEHSDLLQSYENHVIFLDSTHYTNEALEAPTLFVLNAQKHDVSSTRIRKQYPHWPRGYP